MRFKGGFLKREFCDFEKGKNILRWHARDICFIHSLVGLSSTKLMSYSWIIFINILLYKFHIIKWYKLWFCLLERAGVFDYK